MVQAIILAGGIGSRAGVNIPKQFYKVNGKPILAYTLEKFQIDPYIDKIYVVCDESWIKEVKSYKELYGISKMESPIICGNSGIESAYNGVMNIEADNDDIVMIHDAVRPFIDKDIIENNIQTAMKYGCAMTAVNCVETLVYSNDGIYAESMISREGIWRIQTPQTYRYKDIYELFSVTDISTCKEPSTFVLWMNYGKSVYCSRGNEKNIKITYLDDIKYFEQLFK